MKKILSEVKRILAMVLILCTVLSQEGMWAFAETMEESVDASTVVTPTGVTLNKTSATLTSIGETIQLTATVSPSNATDTSVTWKSSDTNVATVTENGLVTAVGSGNATITVSTVAATKSATCTITVDIAVTGISLDKSAISFTAKNEVVQVNATVSPSTATNTLLTWKSSDTSVATVSSSGLVTAVGNGTAVITATTKDGGYTATCVVNVAIATTGVKIDVTSATLTKIGETLTIKATVIPSNAADKSVTWTSSNTQVAKVSGTGVVTAVGSGTAVITVKTNSGGFKASCKITVNICLDAPVLNSIMNVRHGVLITWDSVNGAERYRIFRKTPTSSWIKVGCTTNNSFVDATAESGLTYIYTVRCISNDEKIYTSEYDNEGIRIKYIEVPLITNLSANNSAVLVTWDAVKGAEKYRVFRKTGTSGWSIVGDTASAVFWDKTAKTGVTYTYTIRCITSDGISYTSSYDAEGKSISFADNPQIITLTAYTSGVLIGWDAVMGAENYRVFRKTANGSWKLMADTTQTTYIDKSAKGGNTYTYTVRCVSGDGKYYTSGYDMEGKSITCIENPEIRKLEAYASGVTIGWGEVDGAVNYRIFRKTGSGTWKLLADTTSTTYVDKTAKGGNTYTYTVRCISSDGKYYTSGYDTVGKSITLIANPQIISLTINASGITIDWNSVNGAQKYRVFRRNGNGGWIIIGDSTETIFLDDTAIKGNTYRYTVRCISSDGKTYTSGFDTIGKMITYN